MFSRRVLSVIVSILVIMFIVSSVLTGCGGQKQAVTGDDKNKVQAKGDYKGKFVLVSCNTDQQGLGELEKKFMDKYPGVKLQHDYLPSDKYAELFTAMKNGGEQVDAMMLNPQDLRRYALAGDLIDLTNEITYKDRLRQVGLDTYTVNGKLWAVPWGSIGGFNIYYNKSILDKLGLEYPKTYTELVTISKRLKEKGIDTFTHAGKNIYLWPVWFFSTYAQTSGNKSFEKTIETLQGKRKFTDPEVVKALDLIFQFNRDGIFIKGLNSTSDDGSLANMITGRAVFALGLDWKAVQKAKPKDVVLDVALLPQLTDIKVQSQYPGGPGLAISLYSKIAPERKDIALKFLDFMTTDENIKWIAETQDWPTTTNKNVASLSKEPMIQKFDKEIAENMVTYLDWYWPPEITRAFQEGIQAGVVGQKTAEQVADQIQKVFDKLVQEGYKFIQ